MVEQRVIKETLFRTRKGLRTSGPEKQQERGMGNKLKKKKKGRNQQTVRPDERFTLPNASFNNSKSWISFSLSVEVGKIICRECYLPK